MRAAAAEALGKIGAGDELAIKALQKSLNDENTVVRLKAAKAIQHLGQMPATEIPKWRRKARVTIVASRFEVFGMVAVEALAFGCPLVAARAGALPEIVSHEENGFLFERGSASALAHQLTTMLDQPELSAKLGQQGAKDAKHRFRPAVISRQMKQYYERAIATPSAS